MRTYFVKEGFCEDGVVVAGGEVAGVEGVAELAGVVAGDLSPVLPEGAVAAHQKKKKNMSNLPVCVTHIAKRSLGLGDVETAPTPLFCKYNYIIFQTHLFWNL